MALSYKCTTIGCYSYRSPETNTLFQRLQTVINQFAAAVAFDPLKVDGIVGKGTTEKTLIVLGYLGELDQGVMGASARALEGQINTPEQLVNAAQAVIDVLTLATRQPPAAIAAQLTQPAPLPAPTAQPSAAQLVTTTANAPTKTTSTATQNLISSIKLKRPALATSLVDRVPPWAAYVSGAALAIGAIAAVAVSMKRRKQAAPAVTGHWYT